jgi:DNA-binding transcriptional LysR family regulator
VIYCCLIRAQGKVKVADQEADAAQSHGFGNQPNTGQETMLDLERLKIFIQCVESMSFSQAAKKLHITQPTVSHHIKALEQDVGKPLFIRGKGKLQLTEAARLLLPWARKLLRDSIELQEMMGSIDKHILGQIRIACSTTTGKYILPLYAGRFHARHPGVRVTILRCSLDNVGVHLSEEDANIGVVSYDACGDPYECQEFFSDNIILIAPTNHRWVNSGEIDPSELLEEPFIMREPTSGTRKVMLAELGKHGIHLDQLKVFLEVGNAEAIVKTVQAGFGVAFVSRLAANCDILQGTVVEVPIEGVRLHRTIFMLRKKYPVPNRAVEAFWGFIHDPDNADLLLMAEGALDT